MTLDVLALLGPTCRDPLRRGLILEQTTPPILNGIDYVESATSAGVDVLRVHFLHPLPATAYTLTTRLDLIRIEGGTRIVNPRVLAPGVAPVAVDPTNARVLVIPVEAQGDFSTYWLSLGWRTTAAGPVMEIPQIDRQFSVAPVNFRPGCLLDFDCGPDDDCAVDTDPEPVIDYLAKDYASFRRLLLDVVAQRNPDWLERNPADLGIALLELFAYEGDQLSYLQDAVANEAYLDTARRRVSAKRHARLVDYAMHDGRNAWTELQLAVATPGVVPARTQVATKISVPLRRETAAPGPVIANVAAEEWELDPALAATRVFETAGALRADPTLNQIRVHTWGNGDCCLPVGTTSLHLYHVPGDGLPPGAGPGPVSVLPLMQVGDLLLFEEIVSPDTGAAADADPDHRQVVRVERIAGADGSIVDPLFDATLVGGKLQPFSAAPLQLLEVSWAPADSLRFPLCLTTTANGDTLTDLAVARGNIALADHGRTIVETVQTDPILEGSGLRLKLDKGPLTMAAPAPSDGRSWGLGADVRAVAPAVSLEITGGADPGRWDPVPTLLDSSPWERHFVADIEDDGRALLRFGDGNEGREPAGGTTIEATYRVGNGRAGNIGADALAHLVLPGNVPGNPVIVAVRNPLPARDGVDPETTAEVRHAAPAAFRARQYRAVTEADYVDAAARIPGVAGAVAAFRWTGSWLTVYVGVDPADPADLITEARGRTRLAAAFAQSVAAELDRVRLAGYDLEIRGARYLPVLLDLELCVRPGWFRANVVEAVTTTVSPGRGTRRGQGLFDAANLTFGQPVYLSRIYAAVEAVPGVDSVIVRRLERADRGPNRELELGSLAVGPWEIARLDNDRNRMENGVLLVTASGGK
jgi:hypothetical protein